MRKIILLLSLFIFGVSVYAQKLVDVVYLKNGSIIKGTIVEQIPNQSIRIETLDKSSIIALKIDEVEKITKEENVKPRKSRTGEKVTRFNGLTTGFNIEPNLMLGVTNDEEFFFSTTLTGNYQINPIIALGVGSGIRTVRFEETYVPLFFHFRANILNMKLSPFIDFNTGHAFKVGGDIDGGFMFNSTVGIAIRTGKKQIRVGPFIDFQRYARGDKYYDRYDDFYYEPFDNTLFVTGLRFGASF